MSFIEFVQRHLSLFDIKQGNLWNPIGTNQLGMDIAESLVDLWLASNLVQNQNGPKRSELINQLREELSRYDFPEDTKVAHLSTEEFVLFQALQAIKAKLRLAAMLAR